MAAHRLFGISELFNMVVDQVYENQDLFNLSLVSSWFHKLVTPRLWHTLEWNVGNVPLWLSAEYRQTYLRSEKIIHVRKILVTFGAAKAAPYFLFPAVDRDWTGGAWGVSDALADMVKHCPKLLEFEVELGRDYQTNICRHLDKEMEWGGVIVGRDLMAALAARGDQLTHLQLKFPEGFGKYYDSNSESWYFQPLYASSAQLYRFRAEYANPQFYFGQFRKLKRLDIHGICDSFENWEGPLLECLLANPELEHLQICGSDSFEVQGRGRNDGTTFGMVNRVFEAYGKHRATINSNPLTRPENQVPLLRLRTLKLGYLLDFPKGRTLAKVTDLTAMDNVNIFNNENPVDWDALSWQSMPNLGRLTFSTMDSDFNTRIPYLVSSRQRDAEEAARIAGRQCTPSLQALEVETARGAWGGVYDYDEPGYLEDISGGSNDAPIPMVALSFMTNDPFAVIQRLDPSLTHLSLRGFERHRIHLVVDYSKLDTLIVEAVAPLRNLVALRIDWRRGRVICNLPLIEPRPKAFAMMLAEACKSLTYVEVKGIAWGISRGDGEPKVSLRLLGEREYRQDRPAFFRGEM